jgi:hypothetical protein
MKTRNLFAMAFITLGINLYAQNSKLKVVNEGDDTLFTLSFYIDDVLQSTPSDIYFIDSINHVIIRPDLFLCDTCKSKSYYKFDAKKKLTAVFTNGTYKIVIPKFSIWSKDNDLEFGIITEPAKIKKVYSDTDVLDMEKYMRSYAKNLYYTPQKRLKLVFLNLMENIDRIKYIEYGYITNTVGVSPSIFFDYIYK